MAYKDIEKRREQARKARRLYRERHPEKVADDLRRWREANPERVRAMRSRWKADNPESVAASDRKARFQRRYGITVEEFEAMLERQGGLCAMPGCNAEAVRIDHCHETGVVRGILCHRCNVMLAGIEDPDFLRDALTYLEGGKMMKKYSSGEVLGEDNEEPQTKTAAVEWTEEDRQALEAENAEADSPQ